MILKLSLLEVLIILKCSKQNGLINRTELSRAFRRYDLKAKQKAIKNLTEQNLILVQELPRSGGRKIPVFYKLTDKGKQWVDEYNKNYPKQAHQPKGV